MTWDTVKLILGILFMINVFGLVAILIGLADNKKKFLLYTDQIRRTGNIEKEIGYIKRQFDLFIAAYIFMKIPTIQEYPDLYKIKKMSELKTRIDILTKFAKPLGLFLGILSVTLIILLNIFEK